MKIADARLYENKKQKNTLTRGERINLEVLFLRKKTT
jgi:uncharacterized membrane protein